jgi:protein-arginine kinase activator protein McsA
MFIQIKAIITITAILVCSTCFHGFSAANNDSAVTFFPARQVSEIVLNESSKSTENALKRCNKIFSKFKVYVVSLVIIVVSKKFPKSLESF